MANSVGPDQIPHSVASDLGLHCLLMPDCPNSLGQYSKFFFVCVELELTSADMV